MKSTVKVLLFFGLLLRSGAAVADIDDDRVFRTITASNGIADNSAQTIKCTFTGRMTITTIGSINFYDGANFSHINGNEELTYKLEDYHGHYHLYYDNDHHLWLKNKQTVTCVDLSREHYIHADSIFRLYGAKERVGDMFVDSKGDLWLCENGHVFSRKYGKKLALLKGASLQDLEVHDKELLLFYDNGQLISYDAVTGKRRYQSKAYDSEQAKGYQESGVMMLHDNGFYMIRNGNNGGLLLHYNLDSRQWTEIMRTEEPWMHYNNMRLYEGKLYIASSVGYYTYMLATGEMTHHKTLTLNNGRQLETNINALEFDLQGGMWIGTEERGLLYGRPTNAPFTSLNITDPKAQDYLRQMEPLKGISEFRGKRANVMVVDSRHWTWVGTPNGLYLYTTPQAEPKIYSRANGLLNSVIHAVIEDNFHNIWINTSYGIACLRIEDGEVKQVYCFNSDDNVPNETFVDAKAMKTDDGRIVMQSIDRIVTFQPRDFMPLLNQQPYVMHPKLTKLLVNGIEVNAGDEVNGSVVLNKAITRVKEINLNYDQNSISLTFSALNFSRPLQTYYRVRIREISKQWTDYSYFGGGGFVDSRGLLHLPMVGIQPGTYHVELIASVVQGKFAGKPYEWVIHVNQPWWRTTGILLLFTLIVLAIAILNFIVYNRNTRLKMRRNNEEGDVIRRINSFVNRADSFNTEKLSPTQEEIFGTESESRSELNPAFTELMLKVIDFIHERHGRPYTMHMLSQETNMGVIELYELILENVHKSPRALVRTLRIDKAAELLRTTDMSIEQIAVECDFVSPNYLIAKFYHKYRMTPHEYRETQEQ